MYSSEILVRVLVNASSSMLALYVRLHLCSGSYDINDLIGLGQSNI